MKLLNQENREKFWKRKTVLWDKGQFLAMVCPSPVVKVYYGKITMKMFLRAHEEFATKPKIYLRVSCTQTYPLKNGKIRIKKQFKKTISLAIPTEPKN